MQDQDIIDTAPVGESEAAGWYSEDAATFGDRVAGAREQVGLSQDELARRLGVKVKTLRNWEEDLAEPRANKLQMLSGVLNVSLSWLLTGEGEGVEAPDEEAQAPQDTRSLLTELRQARSELTETAKRIGVLEKRIARALDEAAH